MKAQLEKRLAELKSEYEAGQKALAEMDAKEANLRNTLLRISGAIQVLEEELGKLSVDKEKTGSAPEVESAEDAKSEKKDSKK